MSPFFLRLAAPSTGYRCIVDCIVGNLEAMGDVQRYGFVAELPYEIGLPVPLQTWWVQSVEHALEDRMWNRTDQVERWAFEATNRLESLFRLLGRSRVAPHDAAHFLVVQVLRKGWARWDSEEGKKPVECIGGLCR